MTARAALLVAVIAAVACTPAPGPKSPDQPGAVDCRELARGDMSGNQDMPRATVLDAAAARRLAGPDREWLAEQLEAAMSESPRGETPVLVELGYGSGSELRPVVDGVLTGSGTVHAHWEPDPNGSMTDDVTHRFVLVSCPPAAFPAGIPPAGRELPVDVSAPER